MHAGVVCSYCIQQCWLVIAISNADLCRRNGRRLSIQELMTAFDETHLSIDAAPGVSNLTGVGPAAQHIASQQAADAATEMDEAATEEASDTDWYTADGQSSPATSASEADRDAAANVHPVLTSVGAYILLNQVFPAGAVAKTCCCLYLG